MITQVKMTRCCTRLHQKRTLHRIRATCCISVLLIRVLLRTTCLCSTSLAVLLPLFPLSATPNTRSSNISSSMLSLPLITKHNNITITTTHSSMYYKHTISISSINCSPGSTMSSSRTSPKWCTSRLSRSTHLTNRQLTSSSTMEAFRSRNM